MVFNQFAFLFVFLPVLLLLFFGVFRVGEKRIWLLIVASLIFYMVGGLEHAAMLVIAGTWVYLITSNDRYQGNLTLLLVAIALPLLVLIYYKYFVFILRDVLMLPNAEAVAGQLRFSGAALIIPAGVSFYVFELISYSIDRYRGLIVEQPKYSKFMLFMSFFPHLVAGPIVRYRQVEESIDNVPRFRPSLDEVVIGVRYLAFGLALKVLLADTLFNMAAPFMAKPASLAPDAALFVLLSFSFRIYFDFFGYSLAAIGLGYFFGFRFPENFRTPYLARNLQDFWRRWHISLSSWIKDYLYAPLGGRRRYIRNIMIVFLVCGLWHGAGWAFVLWGALHGLGIVIYHLTRDRYDRMPVPLQIGLTFSFVSVAWLLFAFDLSGAVGLLQSLGGQGVGAVLAGPAAYAWLFLIVCAVASVAVPYAELAERPLRRTRYAALAGASFALLSALAALFLDQSQSFIYYRF